MSMVLIEADELQQMISNAVADAIKNIDATAEEPLFISTKQFAANIGITYQYFKDHLLYEPSFQKAVIQKDRKILIKRELGRKLAEEYLDKYRR